MRKRVLILFTACCVMLAGAAEFRWDFSRSGDGCTGRAVLPPVAAVTLKDGALETGNTSACYRLPARFPAGSGSLLIRFRPLAATEPGREYCLLDVMEGGSGLRLWIDRNGNFACDLRENWQNCFWWTMPAAKLDAGRWNELVLLWSPEKLSIRFGGRTVYEKKQPVLPSKWGQAVALGAFSDGKAAFPLRIASLILSDKAEFPAGGRIQGTFVRPVARRVKPVFGLNLHTRNSDRELPVIAGSGVRRVRFHFSWNEAESEKGVMQLPQSAFDFMASLDRAGLEPLMILAYGNRHYNAPGTPGGFDELKGQNAAFHAGFGRYARYMAETFGSAGSGQVKEYEVWNEENGATPEEYMAVLRSAVGNIRAVDPAAKIIFGGISRMDHAFLLRCFELGAGKLVDAVALHPYRQEVPPEASYQSMRRFNGETANCAEELLKMRETVDRLSPAGKSIPLWITEFGYWTVDAQPSLDPAASVSHDVQAKYLLRSMLQNLALGVDRYYWYRAVDSAFFGLTCGPGYLPRPGYFALRHLNAKFPPGSEFEVLDHEIAVIADTENRRRLEVLYGSFDPHAYLFRRQDGALFLALWNGGRAADRQTELPVADVELPFELASENTGVYDLLLGSDRAWFTSEPVRVRIRNRNGRSRIEGVKFCDTPVLLELKTR